MSTIINDVCGASSTDTKNTGGKKQCTPKPIQSYALARDTFSFASVAASKTKAAWDTAKAAKDIVIFWDVEEFSQANTEATKKEGRFNDYPLKDGTRGLSLKHYLGDCSYDALESYDNSDSYKRMFRINTDGSFTADVQDDGTVKGELIKNFAVGVLNDTTDDTPQNADVAVKFSAKTKSNIEPDFDLITYEGIYEIVLTLVSAAAGSIKFKAASGCSSTLVTSFIDANLILKDAAGAAYTHSFVAADSNGEYEFTGTGFANDFTISLDGVVTQTGIMYDASTPLTISGI